MENETEEIIPIDDELEAFKDHLNRNKKTIFSAKFGDGKTFFLNKFKERYDNEYKIITLYPVNYQIADNKEVFEYIKRDILIQMIRDGMIQESFDIPKHLIVQFYLMHKGGTLLSNLIETSLKLGMINSPEFVMGYKTLKSLMNISKDFNEYEQAIKENDDRTIAEIYTENFYNREGSPYEIDLITHIIIENLKWYKNKDSQNKKKTVLVIEDLDRLDPAHLFRILNIFSAHVDRYYQLGVYKPDGYSDISHESLPNKFGFDNVVLVLDYKNTELIFNHFYGKDADYKGYISKFIDSKPFEYSINDIALNYFYKLIKEECYIDIKEQPDFKKLLSSLSIRDMLKIKRSYLSRISKQIHDCKIYDSHTGNKIRIFTLGPFTKLLSILLLADNDEKRIKELFRSMRHFDADTANCLSQFAILTENVYTALFVNIGHKIYKKTILNNKDLIITACNFEEINTYNTTHTSLTNMNYLTAFDVAIRYIKQ